jgi:hypothetical protein
LLVRKRWQAQGNGSGRGGQIMVYTALVFDGLRLPDEAQLDRL